METPETTEAETKPPELSKIEHAVYSLRASAYRAGVEQYMSGKPRILPKDRSAKALWPEGSQLALAFLIGFDEAQRFCQLEKEAARVHFAKMQADIEAEDAKRKEAEDVARNS